MSFCLSWPIYHASCTRRAPTATLPTTKTGSRKRSTSCWGDKLHDKTSKAISVIVNYNYSQITKVCRRLFVFVSIIFVLALLDRDRIVLFRCQTLEANDYGIFLSGQVRLSLAYFLRKHFHWLCNNVSCLLCCKFTDVGNK